MDTNEERHIFEPRVIQCADGNYLAVSQGHRLPVGAWGTTADEARHEWRVKYRRLKVLIRQAEIGE